MERSAASFESDLNLKETELRLGLPGSDHEQPSSSNKRSRSRSSSQMEASSLTDECLESSAPPPKAQVVGWPPVRCYRKNVMKECGMFVKVSMDGAAYLRKIDLKVYGSYGDLVRGLEKMLKCRIGSEYAATYQDRDGDWMLVGDVPWEMFACSCTRLRIIRAAEAIV